MRKSESFWEPNICWLCSDTMNQRRVWLMSWPNTKKETRALDAATHIVVCDILWPLHQLPDVFWCLKCFESGLPGTGDMGQKKHHQSAACQRERHSILAFWDSPCPLRSCGVTFHVSTSRGWLTWPKEVWSRRQMLLYFDEGGGALISSYKTECEKKTLFWELLWGLENTYPTLNNQPGHHSLVLSLTHYHLQHTAPIPHHVPNGSPTLAISHSPWLISMCCRYYRHTITAEGRGRADNYTSSTTTERSTKLDEWWGVRESMSGLLIQ